MNVYITCGIAWVDMWVAQSIPSIPPCFFGGEVEGTPGFSFLLFVFWFP